MCSGSHLFLPFSLRNTGCISSAVIEVGVIGIVWVGATPEATVRVVVVTTVTKIRVTSENSATQVDAFFKPYEPGGSVITVDGSVGGTLSRITAAGKVIAS